MNCGHIFWTLVNRTQPLIASGQCSSPTTLVRIPFRRVFSFAMLPNRSRPAIRRSHFSRRFSWYGEDRSEHLHGFLKCEIFFNICRYIQRRVPNMRSKMLMPTIQVMCLMWAFYCSLSRITDHRHHWWDVVCGAILGILFSILTVSIGALNSTRFLNIWCPYFLWTDFFFIKKKVFSRHFLVYLGKQNSDIYLYNLH